MGSKSYNREGLVKFPPLLPQFLKVFLRQIKDRLKNTILELKWPLEVSFEEVSKWTSLKNRDVVLGDFLK